MMPKPQLAKLLYNVAHLTGSFRLRSGATSQEYFDKYRFEADPVILREVAEHLRPLVPRGVEAVAGLEMGAIPIVTMLSQLTGLPSVFVRKKPKDYGTCRYAEGGEVANRRLLVVEDVITSGGQIIESARALRRDGAQITHVLCVIDRESGGAEQLQLEKLTLLRLFTMAEVRSQSA